MGTSINYDRPKAVGTNVVGIPLSLKACEKDGDNVPAVFDPEGDTAALDARFCADLAGEGADIQEVFKLEATPTIQNAGDGILKITLKLTAIKGDGVTEVVLLEKTFLHPQKVDAIQTAGGQARA